jgi:tetratricopeptide (TPR) repeat protein
MPSRAQSKPTRWKELREWGGLTLGIVGTVLALVSFRQGERNAALTTQIALANRDIEVEKLLDEAWDLMGGRTGSTYIDKLSQESADLEQARRRIDQALLKDPNSARAYRCQGVYFEAIGAFDRSIRSYEWSLKKDPSAPGTYVNLGLTYSAKGDRQRAIRSLRKAQELDPTDPLIAFDLGVVYAEDGLHREAAAERKRAMDLLSRHKGHANRNLVAMINNPSSAGALSGRLPRTSSDVPLLAIVGALALASALVLRIIRGGST